MPGDLSHGLPELLTSANQILRADTMQPVLLRGVNRSGLEYTPSSGDGFLAAAQFTADEMREIIVNWGCNIIRLPFNQDWALHGSHSHSTDEYLTSIDQVISWAASLGAYTILDLQWLDAETVYGHIQDKDGETSDNHVPPTPNSDSITLWKALAKRYRDETAVLFDILNEPHDPLEDDVLPLYEIGSAGDVIETNHDSVGPKEWVPWAERLVAEIRGTDATLGPWMDCVELGRRTEANKATPRSPLRTDAVWRTSAKRAARIGGPDACYTVRLKLDDDDFRRRYARASGGLKPPSATGGLPFPRLA